MKTVKRTDSRFKPKPNFNNSKFVLIDDRNLGNLIKRADEYCERYSLDYDEPIYKVIELNTYNIMTNTSARLKSNKTRYSGTTVNDKVYYEAKLRKVDQNDKIKIS